ncbi:hypothetical protein VTL71DRAFT_6170 [Oculimacula yallundae]|uniref:DUF6590 domain-containing protein n=1 Tax=Oculimacula yallundae TaxID=86028 RepID=A0ABR4C265_9HELO
MAAKTSLTVRGSSKVTSKSSLKPKPRTKCRVSLAKAARSISSKRIAKKLPQKRQTSRTNDVKPISKKVKSVHVSHVSLDSNVNSEPASKTQESVRLFGEVLEPQFFKPGQIISVASHEEVYQDANNKIKLGRTREQTLTSLGWVYSKSRKIVVISRFAQHLVGLPIYSHGGKRLEKKQKSEFVGIRDAKYFRRTSTESTYPSILSHRVYPFALVDKKHWAVINGDSYVQFTRPMSFAYNTRCTIEGQLQDGDLQALIHMTNSRTTV